MAGKDTKFKKGMTPWNKGKRHPHSSPSLFKKGHITPMTPEIRKKMSMSAKRRVANGTHNFGDGSKTKERQKIYNSFEYREWRRHVFNRDDFTCQACGQRGGELHVDHELPFALFPDLRFEILNGRTLCIPCHKGTITWARNASNYDKLTQIYG